MDSDNMIITAHTGL